MVAHDSKLSPFEQDVSDPISMQLETACYEEIRMKVILVE